MRNIRELSIGSIVWVSQPDAREWLCQVVGIYEKMVKVKVLHSSTGEPSIIGTEYDYPIGRINALDIMEHTLKDVGFIESDERAWKLMYYFGDMRLYWKYNSKLRYSTFKFKADFTEKRWVRIDCKYMHALQNIMRFLTGGEMEFNYSNNSDK